MTDSGNEPLFAGTLTIGRMLTTAVVVAAMSVAYAGYARFTRPLLRSEATRPMSHVVDEPPIPEGLEELSTGLLRWEGAPNYSVNRDSGLTRLLFDDYRIDPDDPGLVELWPFAFIITNPEQPDRPYVIQSDMARMRFDEFNPFSSRGAKIGKLLEGTLVDRVSISGPDGLSIEGRTFKVTDELLFSDNPVEFAFGPSRDPNEDFLKVTGRAGNLIVELQTAGPGQMGTLGKQLPPWTGIESLWLRNNVQVEVVSDTSQPGHAKKPDHITIACDDKLRYLVDKREAWFEKNVRVAHSNSHSGSGFDLPGMLHRLSSCKALTLKLDPTDGDGPTVANMSFALELRTVEAIGRADAGGQNPRDSQLLLEAFSDDVAAYAGKLHYDLKTREAVLAVADAVLNPLAPFVAVRLGEQELFSPVVRAKTDDNSDLEQALFVGRGALQTVPDKDRDLPAVRVNWNRQVEVVPEASSTGEPQYRITAEGDVRLEMPDEETELVAPRVIAWVDATDEFRPGVSTESVVQADREKEKRVPLRRVLADQGARIVRPGLDVAASSVLELLLLPIDTITNPLQQTAGRRESNANENGTAGAGSDESPLYATAKSISLALGLHGRDAELLALTAEHDVKLEQAGERPDGPPRLHVSGDRVTLSGRGLAQQLSLIGNAAHLEADGMSLEAGTVNADRAAGSITVPGPGELRIPMSGRFGMSSESDLGLGDSGVLTVRWNERVEFVGQTVRFFGQVVADRGDAGNTKVHCEELSVELTRAIDFRTLTAKSFDGKSAEPIDLKTLTFRHNVQISSEEWTGTELTTLRTIALAELSFDQASERFHGVGPGVVKQWAIEKPNPDDVKTLASIARPPYRLSKVSFNGDLDGDARLQWLRLARNVKALTGIVPRTLIDLTRDDLLDRPGQPPDAVWVGCDTLEVSLDPTWGKEKSRPSPPPRIQQTGRQMSDSFEVSGIQVRASGQVELEGRQFRAIADSASVDRSTGLISIRGTGGNPASVWRQVTPGAPMDVVRARAFRINPVKQTFEADEAAGFWLGR